jgi:hypothetical protein
MQNACICKLSLMSPKIINSPSMHEYKLLRKIFEKPSKNQDGENTEYHHCNSGSHLTPGTKTLQRTYKAVPPPMVQALRRGMRSKSTFRFAIENPLVSTLVDEEVSGQVWMEAVVSWRGVQSLYEEKGARCQTV